MILYRNQKTHLHLSSSNMLIERLCDSSDKCEAQICMECDRIAENGWCPCCESSRVGSIKMPYAAKLLFTELNTMNISTRFELKPYCDRL